MLGTKEGKMKKLIIYILIGVVLFFFVIGINTYSTKIIKISPDNLVDKGINIPKQEGYKVNFNHPYEMVETEDGYDLIIHFVKE